MNDSEDAGRDEPDIIPRPEHNVSRADISPSALKVLYRLHNAGFQAFLVGGGVRDLLLELHPKDFDIATDASPDEVRGLFRNCRLIGRRFRLAHVHFGREVIEVATFRAAHDEADEDVRHTDDSGRILRDNVYGSVDEDVWRRDFTANALYYNIADYSIWDYVGGVRDVRDRVMRLIGDPDVRYREDPVRMLRAVRFAAKLGFAIEPGSEAPLTELGELLHNVPPARLFDETIKLFLAGHAVETFRLLRKYDLFRYMFPATAAALESEHGEQTRRLLDAAMVNTDQRVAEDRPVTIMFLLAVFMWEPIRQRALALADEEDMRFDHALFAACDQLMRAQQAHVTVPKRIMYPIRDMVVMQDRFEARKGNRPARLARHPRFRAAYDLLLLRAASGEVETSLATWWTEYQESGNAPPPDTDADGDADGDAEGDARPGRRRGRRRRRPRRRAKQSGGQ